MKWLVTLFMVVVILSAPAASAEEKEYTVRPSNGETPPVSILIYDSITQGQTK
ncbi:MAG: hypothetical protein SCH70_11410 [Candidatus Methanoperedens sp.]|nr:hypothetical protein [Candidatus Methanoperedens sp.]